MKLLGLWRALGSRMQGSLVPTPSEGVGEGYPPLLLLPLLLLASLTPAGSTEAAGKVDIDLSPGAFDDQYRGCHQQVMEALNQGDYFTQEVDTHRNYSRLWHRAHLSWLGHSGAAPHGLSAPHAVALQVYASHAHVRAEFSRAVACHATSPLQYRRAFHFKFLHYYLTSAIQLLRSEVTSQEDGAPCRQVHHAMEDGVMGGAHVGATLRFGRFLLTTPRREEAQMPGPHTLLTLVTCLGAPLHEFSPKEAVLVPPYEVFVVVNGSHREHGDWWHLRSAGNRSTYNCQLLKASSHQPAPSALLMASLSGLVGLQSLFQKLSVRERCSF